MSPQDDIAKALKRLLFDICGGNTLESRLQAVRDVVTKIKADLGIQRLRDSADEEGGQSPPKARPPAAAAKAAKGGAQIGKGVASKGVNKAGGAKGGGTPAAGAGKKGGNGKAAGRGGGTPAAGAGKAGKAGKGKAAVPRCPFSSREDAVPMNTSGCLCTRLALKYKIELEDGNPHDDIAKHSWLRVSSKVCALDYLRAADCTCSSNAAFVAHTHSYAELKH